MTVVLEKVEISSTCTSGTEAFLQRTKLRVWFKVGFKCICLYSHFLFIRDFMTNKVLILLC